MAEIRVGALAANLVGTVLAIVLCVAGVWLARMLPHHVRFNDWHALGLLGSFVALLPAHEFLHGLGLRLFANVPWQHIKFGVMWRALMPYCHCQVPVSVRAYRRMALLPLWGTGSLALAALVAFPSDWLGFIAGFAVAACVGDVWMVAKLRPFQETLLVRDSPSTIGCDVLAEPPAPDGGQASGIRS